MEYSWLTLLPPVIVIIVTIITRNVLISLVSGIVSASLIASNGNFLATMRLAGERILSEINADHLYTFGFLVLLGVLIQLMNHSGGIRAYTHLLLKFIKTPVAAQQTSLMLSSGLFIDDYVNNLTVGAIMRPVTDHFNIARAKLAFLLDSMSGPMCMLIPASSWVAFILGQMQSAGISQRESPEILIKQDPLMVYIKSIPFLLYPLLIVFSAWFIVSARLSFGRMALFEKQALGGDLYGGKVPLYKTAVSTKQFNGSLIDFIVPITTFLVSLVAAIGYSGGSILLGGTASCMQTLQAANPFWALWIASLIAVVTAIGLFIYKNYSDWHYVASAFFDGFMLMKNSLLVLLLAWTLSSLLKNDLQTGSYLASLLPAHASAAYLPLVLFIFCLVISASTGSVWGTIALMLPITIPLYYQIAPVNSVDIWHLYPILGALFSGAVAGSHFSPITDGMVMTSFSAGCYHLDHVRTQMGYAVYALIGSCVGYALLGFMPIKIEYAPTVLIIITSSFLTTITLLSARAWYTKQ